MFSWVERCWRKPWKASWVLFKSSQKWKVLEINGTLFGPGVFSQTRSGCPLGCIIEAPLRPLHKAFFRYPWISIRGMTWNQSTKTPRPTGFFFASPGFPAVADNRPPCWHCYWRFFGFDCPWVLSGHPVWRVCTKKIGTTQEGKLNHPFGEIQTIQICGWFWGISVHCLGW